MLPGSFFVYLRIIWMDMVNSRQGFAFFCAGPRGVYRIQKERPWQAAVNYGSLLMLFYGGRTCDRRVGAGSGRMRGVGRFGKKESKMIELSCSQLKKYYGAQLVLENITFEVQEGERVAVIGKNGCGKSTILKLITRVEAPDEGCVSIRKNAVTGYLEQMPVYEEKMTVRQVCEQAFCELVMLQEQMQALERALENAAGSGGEEDIDVLLKKYTLLQERYEAGGGYEMEERFARICTGLKLSGEFLEAEFRTLSGGEKTLACLAKVLLQNPDILVLDEPTNHLDMSMLQWLEEYLKNYKGTVLMVSHDRYFLDAAATRILEVEDGTAVEYLGNYSYYLEEKERRRQRQLDAYKEQQKKVKAMEKAIKDMRSWAAQADNESMYKRAASMQKRLDRMEKVERPKNDGPGMRVTFEEGERSGKDVLLLEGVAKSFGNKKLFPISIWRCIFRSMWLCLEETGVERQRCSV